MMVKGTQGIGESYLSFRLVDGATAYAERLESLGRQLCRGTEVSEHSWAREIVRGSRRWRTLRRNRESSRPVAEEETTAEEDSETFGRYPTPASQGAISSWSDGETILAWVVPLCWEQARVWMMPLPERE